MTDTKPEAPEVEETLRDIEKNAQARTQRLLTLARDAIHEVENALKEVAPSPFFSNGLANSIKKAHATAVELGESLAILAQQTHKHFHPESEGDAKPVVVKGGP